LTLLKIEEQSLLQEMKLFWVTQLTQL